MSLKNMAVKMALAFAAAKGVQAFQKSGGMSGIKDKLAKANTGGQGGQGGGLGGLLGQLGMSGDATGGAGGSNSLGGLLGGLAGLSGGAAGSDRMKGLLDSTADTPEDTPRKSKSLA